MYPLSTFVIIISFLVSSASAAEEGGRPGEFLRYGVSCRALAMGKAFVSIADDGSAIYWNPAGIISADSKEFTTMYTDLFYDSRYTYFALILPRSGSAMENPLLDFILGHKSAWGFGWVNLSAGDFMQYGYDNDWIGRNYFDYNEHALFFTFSREMVNPWGIFDFGTNLKFVKQGFSGLLSTEDTPYSDDEQDWSAGLDLGMKIQLINMPGLKWIPLKYLMPLRVGFNIQNLFRPTMNFGGDECDETYPRAFRWGLSYGINAGGWHIMPALDVEHCSNFKDGIYAGCEVNPGIDDIFLRLGFNNRNDRFACGFGLNLDVHEQAHMKFDYSFGYHSNSDLRNFGGEHQISLTVRFGEHFGPEHFNERANVIEESSEISDSYLHVIAQYPNDRVRQAALQMANTYDEPNKKRYLELVGGIGLAEILFAEAKQALKDENLGKAKNSAEEAVTEYHDEIEADDKVPEQDIALNYTEALMIAGRFKDAVDVSNRYQYPSQRYYYQLGISYKNIEQYDTAVQNLEKSIEYKDDQKSMLCLSYLALAECQMAVEKYEAAIETAAIIVDNYFSSLAPDYPRYPIFTDDNIVDDAQYLIGMCYQYMGQTEEACKAFAKIKRMYPDLEKAKDGSSDKSVDELNR